MALYDAMELARNYAKLGGAVQEQLELLVEDPSDATLHELNLNAVAMIHEYLTDTVARHTDQETAEEAEGLAEVILDYAKEHGATIEYGRVKPLPGHTVDPLGLGR